ncbi:MAG: hypothetical protein LUF92_13065 [Clostridiales bacterium]|nr:hypothetical protein [Clostridiales bacterium]
MNKKKRFVIVCIMAALILEGCGPLQDISASGKEEINTTEELYQKVQESLKNGQEEICFVTRSLKEEDLQDLNEEHDGFYGNVTQYQMKSWVFVEKTEVTLLCEISDNFYVERAVMEGEEIPEDRQEASEIRDVCEEILESFQVDESDYEKEKAIHDYLVENVSYGYPEGVETEDSSAYNVYGALVEGKAVCNGYAQAMKLLCDLSGVECDMISGQAEGESHAWNLVCLDGKWYHVDVTWDDPEPDDPDRILYCYFNLDDQQMGQSHSWDEDDYVEAEGTEYQYYRKMGLICSSIDDLKEKCEEIFEETSRGSFQVLVSDYDVYRYSEKNLQFIFEYSGARYLNLQTIGKRPYTILYFTLEY